MDLLLQTMDNCLWPQEIDDLLDKAIRFCPVMKKHNLKMYPEILRRISPFHDDEYCILGAQFLNTIAFDGI